ncbi:MAG: exo-beta-N-acetylmuramidase NamZ domain-containing protein [bacterium]
MNNPNLSVLLSFLLLSVCQTRPVETGLDRISEYQHLFAGKRVGIVTNHTAYNSKNEHIVDVFGQLENVTVTALFAPEHGIRGHEEAGKQIQSESDPVKDIPIFSLYGKTRKPTEDMLTNFDILVFDIQDIGARFYTYIYTMALAMEAAAEQNKPFVVLDRPNPITGAYVEGNILEPEFASFVGLYPIPVRHGMTVGELATMFNKEGWLKNGVTADLTVVPMNHWQRSLWYDETGLRFIKPSPNMPDLASATLYPGACLLEGTNVSEGRGTQTPFELFGAPWIDAKLLTQRLNELEVPGVAFRETSFTPVSMPGAAANPKYKNKECYGSTIMVTDRLRFSPYVMGLHIVRLIHEMYPDSLQWHVGHFDRLCGSARVRETILQEGGVSALQRRWQERLQGFMKMRQKYLMYD